MYALGAGAGFAQAARSNAPLLAWSTLAVVSQVGVFPLGHHQPKHWFESHGGRKPGASRSRRAVWVIAPSGHPVVSPVRTPVLL